MDKKIVDCDKNNSEKGSSANIFKKLITELEELVDPRNSLKKIDSENSVPTKVSRFNWKNGTEGVSNDDRSPQEDSDDKLLNNVTPLNVLSPERTKSNTSEPTVPREVMPHSKLFLVLTGL